MKDECPLPESIVRNYSAQILNGLAYMHQKRVCHNDLKPQNLLMDKCARNIKICDFGVVTFPSLESSSDANIFGTVNYASPERVSGKFKISTKSDIWSFGIFSLCIATDCSFRSLIPFTWGPTNLSSF